MASTDVTQKAAENQVARSSRTPSASALESQSCWPFRLIVKEYIPHFIKQTAPAKTIIVDRLDQVLAIPWISKLPGEKQLVLSRGQRVVVQHYLGYHLVRAHVHWDYEPKQ